MKSIVVFLSIHHKNTEKIAKEIAKVLNAKLADPEKIKARTILEYDLIGFGSGIYFWKHHKKLLNFVDEIPFVKNKKAFIFSTSGISIASWFHAPLRKKLISKGFKIIGEFNCPGFDTFCLLKLFGGINKGRPNEKDLKKAREFANKIKFLNERFFKKR
ncbi:MAG: flavodoxin family protein [Candidatus Pacearchaeota archaeon]